MRRSTQPLALAEAIVKTIAAISLVLIGFWAGHAYSSFRMEEEVMPAIQRFQALASAGLLVKGVELIDSGETVALRKKLLAVAKAQTEPLPPLPTNWRAVLAFPFFYDTYSVRSLDSNDEANATHLRERITKLETGSSSPRGAFEGVP
jgi:hypothetical protein